MDLALQIWGGVAYLANKIFFAIGAHHSLSAYRQRQLKIAAWLVYVIGVPAWVIILAGERNWIAASVEAGGVPAILLGLFLSIRGKERGNVLIEKLVESITYLALFWGISLSIYKFGGINTLSQLLELGIIFGFLLGSIYMAKQQLKGWIFFMIMNISTAALMLIQAKYILFVQQILSLGFVIYGYRQTLKKSHIV